MSEGCKYSAIEQISNNIDCEQCEMAVQGTQSKKITKKWEIFAGRNRFYCDGRLMTAPHSGVFLLTVCLITGTSTLFFIFDCRYLAENVTCAIPIIGGLLFVFTMSALLRTSLTDPGIIPRATSDEAEYTEKQIEVPNSANSPTYRPPPRTKEVLVKGLPVKLKYCFTCKIFRPPRASHCSLCDNCVDRFDHHCPWVGNCVGKRNYRFFYMFIVSLAFLAVFIFACAIAHLILITKNDRQFLDAVKESPASVIVAVVCFFSVWSILGLAGFHTYLTTSNQTTNEDIKGSFTSKRGQESFNPYSQGNVCLNCFHVLCGPVAPSLIDRRGTVTEEYKPEVNPMTVVQVENRVVAGKTYGTVKNGISQISLNTEQPLPGLYRQSMDHNGTYGGSAAAINGGNLVVPSGANPIVTSPFKKHLYRAHHQYAAIMSPAKPCSAQRIIPSGLPSAVLPSYQDPPPAKLCRLDSGSTVELLRYSSSLPRIAPHANTPVKHYLPQRPRSTYVYENFYVRDAAAAEMQYRHQQQQFCNVGRAVAGSNDCGGVNVVSRTRSDNRAIYGNLLPTSLIGSANAVKVRNFPVPEFSKLYVQDAAAVADID